MKLICSMFHEVVSNRLKRYCYHAAKPKRGENEFYVRKMPFQNINSKSKQRVFFPQPAEPSFLWE